MLKFIFSNGLKHLQPRLGPKPFSSEPSEFSFDQVFSVPQFPSNEDFEETDNKEISTTEEKTLESFGNIILHNKKINKQTHLFSSRSAKRKY